MQGIFGGADKGSGVGTQGLGEDRVAFDGGPGSSEGVGSGEGELVVLVGGEGVTGGTLDELVNTDGLMGGVGVVIDEAEPVQGAQGLHGVPGGNRL
uniref:hypothetical protein n=1 Tax=Actinacidiphila soli TaxID=2487275 RepID=UPI001F0B9FC6|nr:hypothetical protein [Actinacidiphila soli]